MRTFVSPQFHLWAQTASVILTSGISIVALIFGVTSFQDTQASIRELEVQKMWTEYLGAEREYFSRDFSAKKDSEYGVKTEILLNYLALKLENIDEVSDGKIWDERINDEIEGSMGFFCYRDGGPWVMAKRFRYDPFRSKFERRMRRCGSEAKE